jgi:hypothetical protein
MRELAREIELNAALHRIAIVQARVDSRAALSSPARPPKERPNVKHAAH